MSQSATFRVGKAHGSIVVVGCVTCGTQHGSGWTEAKEVVVMVGTRTLKITAHRCRECTRKMEEACDE